MKRVIFDLDGTLLYGTFENENVLFRALLTTEAEKFIQNKRKYLCEYEELYPNYEQKLFSYFLSEVSGINFEVELVNAWIELNAHMEDKIDEDAISLLEYIKRKNYKCSVLTNWFSKTQIERLKNSGLFPYFDTIICGDRCLKPNRESYLLACNGDDPNQCVMIGDDLEKDVIGPARYGINSIYYSKETNENGYLKIKRLREFQNFY